VKRESESEAEKEDDRRKKFTREENRRENLRYETMDKRAIKGGKRQELAGGTQRFDRCQKKKPTGRAQKPNMKSPSGDVYRLKAKPTETTQKEVRQRGLSGTTKSRSADGKEKTDLITIKDSPRENVPQSA